MKNPILEKRKLVQDRIEKSFDSGINVPEEVEIEKAHQDGEIHPNGKWVWVSSAAGGKGDWRTRGGRTHNAHSENEKKFKQNFKNAKDGILQKIIDGKIQAGAHEKKWAQDILDERKKGSAGEKAAKKIIDLIKISSSKYSDISKVVAFKTDKGNWAIDYDGANTGLIIGKDHLSEAELNAAGVKIEGANANKKTDSKDDVKAVQNIPMPDLNGGSKSITLGDGRTVTVQIKNLNKENGYVIGKISGGGSNQFKFGGASGKSVDDAFDLVKKDLIKNIGGSTKKADPKQDKVAQAAGFKDYEEMKGWQDYTTAKNLLKKPSMKLKSKEADRKELEKQVADYEKDHVDVIAARGGKKSGPKTSNPTDNGNTEDNATGKVDKVKKWEEEFSKDALRYLNEDVKYGTIKDRYGEEAEKVAKRILAKRKKERKDFIDSAPKDFTEEQVKTYLSKYNLQSEPSAVVKNTWNTLMGRIGNTSATISVGKGKFKEFSTYNAPDWRPIGDYHYSTRGWDGKYIDINGTIQSWDDVKNALSDTENMTIHIYKHPKQ